MVAAGATPGKSSGKISSVRRAERASSRAAAACFAVGALCAVCLALASCIEAPPSFERVQMPEATALRDQGALVIDARAPSRRVQPVIPGGVLWQLSADEAPEPPELPRGPVLVVSDSEAVGYRAAAALARDGNRQVSVVIPESAEERGKLYAHDPQRNEQQKETPRGRDS